MGQACEQKVLNDLVFKGWKLIEQNHIIAGIEIDLLVQKDIIAIIEVKSLRSADEIGFRVSKRQLNRLFFARQCLQERKNRLVDLKFAFVMQEKILYLPAEALL